MLLLLFVVVGSFRRNPKHENRLLYVDEYGAYRLETHSSCGDQLARFVHRGVGGSARVMVQLARVVVGATS